MGNASVLAFFLRVVLGIAVWARLVRASLKKLENLTSSGEEPHCPPLTAGLRPSLSLSLSLYLSLYILSAMQVFGARHGALKI